MPPKPPALPANALNPPRPSRAKIDWDDPGVVAFEQRGRKPFDPEQTVPEQSDSERTDINRDALQRIDSTRPAPEGSEVDRTATGESSSNHDATDRTVKHKLVSNRTDTNEDASYQDALIQYTPRRITQRRTASERHVTDNDGTDKSAPHQHKKIRTALGGTSSEQTNAEHPSPNGNLESTSSDQTRTTAPDRNEPERNIIEQLTLVQDALSQDAPNHVNPVHGASNITALENAASNRGASDKIPPRRTETSGIALSQAAPDHSDPAADDLDELLDAWRSGNSDKRRRREPARTVATNLKLTPPLWEVVDRLTDQRGVKKNRYVVGILERRLPQLIHQLEEGAFDLPPVPGQGRERRGISLALPLGVADDLNRIIADTGIVQHELLLRLVVPEVIKDWEEARRRGGR
jgi:hypothetical protein